MDAPSLKKENTLRKKYLVAIGYEELNEQDQSRVRDLLAEQKGDVNIDLIIQWCHSVNQEMGFKVNINKLIVDMEQKDMTLERTPFNLKEAMQESTSIIAAVHRFTKMQPIVYDKANIWWIWNFKSLCWTRVDEIDILNSLDVEVESFVTINRTMKGQIMDALKRIGRLNMPPKPKKTWVQFRNITVDIETSERMPITPKYFFTNPIPWKLGTSEETPVLDSLFKEWVGEEYLDTLYEIAAYCLIPDYPIHRIFCFLGSGMNGKSTYMSILHRFLGMHNITSTELDILIKSNFEAAKLHKKLACFMGETNFSGMKKTSMLKRLSSGTDLISFEFKNKNPFDDYNYAKLIIATNALPETLDKTVGFYRRWLLVDFPNTFTEARDILIEIPDEEYENLARKSVNILKELLKTRNFTNEGDIAERERRYEDSSNPLQKFLKEQTIIDPNSFVYKYEFAQEMEVWLKTHGHRVWSKKEIGTKMKQDFEEGKRDIKVNGEWKQYRVWQGLSFLSTKKDTSVVKTIFPDTPDISDTNFNQISIKGSELKRVSDVSGVSDVSDELSHLKKKTSISTGKPKYTTEHDYDKIYQKCAFCDLPESAVWSRTGKPMCELCIDNINLKNEWPEHKHTLNAQRGTLNDM